MRTKTKMEEEKEIEEVEEEEEKGIEEVEEKEIEEVEGEEEGSRGQCHRYAALPDAAGDPSVVSP